MKAIILSHERGGSYAMDREGGFRFVKGYASQPIGTEIELQTQYYRNYRRLAAIAACFALVFALSGFAWLWTSESCVVYVKINPSVELVFNGFNRLKAAKPLNEDGAALLKGLKLKGSLGDVIVLLINEA